MTTFTAVPSAGSKLRSSTLAAIIAERTPLFATVGTNQNLTTSSTTLQNVTDLVVTPSVSRTYEVLVVVYAALSSGTTEDIKVGFSFPSGATLTAASIGGSSSGVTGTGASDMNMAELSVTSGSTAFSFGASTSNTGIVFHGVLTMSTTAGNFQVMAAQNTSGPNTTTVVAGSYVKLVQAL